MKRMQVIYKDKWYFIDLPDDTKYFRLTRKYYPDKKFEIGEEMVELKYLKCEAEIRRGTFNKHHMNNKSRGGSSIESNLLTMDINRHNCFHILFGNLSFSEVIELLKRVQHAKESQRFKVMFSS